MKKTNEFEKIKDKLVPILKAHNVTKAGIFGSYGRGEHNKKSDIDILVKLDDSYDLFDIVRLKMLIEKRLRKKIDLVEYECIRKQIRRNILDDEIPIIR